MKTHESPEYGKGFYAYLNNQTGQSEDRQLPKSADSSVNKPQAGESVEQITATAEQIELMREAYPQVLSFCRYIDPDLADDLAQTASIQFLTKAHTLKDNNNIRGWLNVAALNTARQYWRRKKEYPSSDVLGDILPPDGNADPLNVIIDQENRLDDEHTLAVVRAYEERRNLGRLDLALASHGGKTHAEIGAEIDATAGAVTARIHRFHTEVRSLPPETFQRPMVRRPDPYGPPERY